MKGTEGFRAVMVFAFSIFLFGCVSFGEFPLG